VLAQKVRTVSGLFDGRVPSRPRLARAKMQASRCAGQANRSGEHAILAIAKASVKQVASLLSQWTTYHGAGEV